MSLKTNHKGPLSGYRIVDLSSHITGPYATMLLADQGAEVIRVESPAGDLMRQGGTSRNNLAAFFITSNRNKQSIALDLKKPEAIEALYRLVETADVFVQNYRPGVAERLGLGEQVLRNRKKDLIYVSISGFGTTGPYASRRVYDTVIQAISGFPHIQKGTRKTPEIARTVVADKVTAQTVAQGVTAALLARERGKGGQHIEISMLDALVAWLWPDTMTDLTFVDEEGVDYLAGIGAVELIFATQDGYIMVLGISDSEFGALVTGLGMPQLVEDERFASLPDRLRNAKAFADILRKELVKHTTSHWNDRFAELDAVSAPMNTPDDLLCDPQIIASETLIESEHPTAGKIRQPRHPIRFAATPADSAAAAAPVLGEHTHSIFEELGYSKQEIDAFSGV